jgi:hypothetical protein
MAIAVIHGRKGAVNGFRLAYGGARAGRDRTQTFAARTHQPRGIRCVGWSRVAVVPDQAGVTLGQPASGLDARRAP